MQWPKWNKNFLPTKFFGHSYEKKDKDFEQTMKLLDEINFVIA